MNALYSRTVTGTPSVTLPEAKLFMKVTATADDAIITQMVSAATQWGENYTAREFRANTWQLLLDEFIERICLSKAPVDSISSIQYLKATALTSVLASTYYLKNSLQFSEILLNKTESWPADIDEREQAVTIEFITKSYEDVDSIKTAILRHVAYWYKNRGDCGGGGSSACTCDQAAKGSGATSIYDQFRIDRV